MAKELLKLDDEQRDGLTQWLADPHNLNPHDAFRAMQIAPGLGSHPERSELELSPLDHLAQRFGYITDRTKKAEALSMAQETLLPFVQKAIGQKIQMKLLQQMAPTYGQAQERGVSIPAPMQEQMMTFPGSAELPGHLDPSLLPESNPGLTMGFTPSTATSPGIPIRERPSYPSTEMPLQQANPGAKLSPQDLQLYENVIGGHGVMDEGKYVPMQLAKLPGSHMSATEANAALKAFGVEGVQPFTEPVPTSFINEMMKQQRGEGQPAIIKEQTELSRLQRMPDEQRTPSHQAMIQTLQDSINRQTALNPDNDNAWAGALFGPNVTYKNLSKQRPVTPAQSQQWRELHSITIPPGTSSLAAVKAAQVQTQGQVLGYAGAQAKGEAQLDIPLGPKANDYRKLTPDGRIVQAGPRQTPRQAGQQNYVDIKGYEDTIERAQTVRVTEDRVRDVQKLGMDIFKADPGILSKGKQIVELSLSSFANAGKKIGYTVDGKPLTLGEGVNLYNGKVKQMLEAVARSVNAVKGAGTEGDIVRQLEGFPQANVDTAATAKAKYDSLLGTFVNSRRALYSTVFGEEAADVFAKQASGGKTKTPDERMDEIETLLKQRLGKS